MFDPLSNIDLDEYINEIENKGAQIYKAEKIEPNMDIENIFKGRGHCIFHCGPNNSGHWVCNLRTPNNEVFFIDSFGESPDYYSPNIIDFYKNNGIKNLYVNKKTLQNDNSQVCGRYTVALIALHKMGMNPDIMIDFLNNGKKKFGSVDNFILEITKK